VVHGAAPKYGMAPWPEYVKVFAISINIETFTTHLHLALSETDKRFYFRTHLLHALAAFSEQFRD
jgi:hypothetical protein